MKQNRSWIAFVALVTSGGLALLQPSVAGARPGPGSPPPNAPDAAIVAARNADRAAESGFDALAKGPNESYVRRDVVTGSGGARYVSYERTYRGLPVIGGDAVVVTDAAGNVRETVSALNRAIGSATPFSATPFAATPLSVIPKVTAGRAAAIARAQVTTVERTVAPRLVVHAGAEGDRLAWEALVTGTKSGGIATSLHVFVDALTGSIVDTRDDVRYGTGNGHYNGQVTFNTTGSGNSFSMADPTRSGLRCGGQNGATFTGTDDVWGNGSGTNLETACVDAMYAAQKEWDMLGQWLNRNGINGSGGGFPSRVGLNEVNAFWNGSFTNFGHNQANTGQATGMDVVAHEYGHAIFQTTPGGAGAGNENGGLNEGTGDIFGALTEHFANNPNDPPDYLVGEEINLTGSGPIRNMYNPSALGDPNCFSSAIPGTEVHAAAGPLNHWFYLLAEGSNPGGGKPSSPICAGGPSSVTGVGIQKAGRIYMGALNRKTSAWRYVNVRTAALASAVQLFGASSPECAATRAAWNAVAVPAQAGEAQCTTAPGNDFSLSVSPSSGTVQRGASVTTTVSTATTSGAAQSVTLTAGSLPAGVTASFSPATVTSGGSSVLTLTASATAALGTTSISILGTGTSASHSATFSLTVTSPPTGNDFSVSVSPASIQVRQGSTGTASVATATISGNPQTVNLSISGAPTGVTASVTPSSVTSGQSATLDVAVATTATPGTYTLTVSGTGTGATHAATLTLTVTTGDPGGCGGLPAWNANTAYAPNDVVSHNGRRWLSTWWSTGAEPGAPQSWAVWSDQGSC